MIVKIAWQEANGRWNIAFINIEKGLDSFLKKHSKHLAEAEDIKVEMRKE